MTQVSRAGFCVGSISTERDWEDILSTCICLLCMLVLYSCGYFKHYPSVLKNAKKNQELTPPHFKTLRNRTVEK